MIQRLLTSIKLRAAIVFLLIHAGLILAVYGLAGIPHDSNAFWFVLAGITGLYGGVVYAIFSVVMPLAMLVRRFRQLMQWKEFLLKELPQILAALPALIEAAKSVLRPYMPQPAQPQATAPAPAPAPAPAAPPA